MRWLVERESLKDREFIRRKVLRYVICVSSSFALFAIVSLRRHNSRADLGGEFRNNILPLLNKFCSALYQVICAKGIAARDISGHGHHLAILFHRKPRGYQRPASLRRLDDQKAQTQSADNAIAIRKILLERRRAKRELRDEAAAFCEYLADRTVVLAWIYRIKPRAHNGDGAAIGTHCSAMGSRVDAACKAGCDRYPARGKVACKHLRSVLAVCRTGTGTDDADARLIKTCLPFAFYIKHRRRVGDLPKYLRIASVVEHKNVAAEFFDLIEFAFCPLLETL